MGDDVRRPTWAVPRAAAEVLVALVVVGFTWGAFNRLSDVYERLWPGARGSLAVPAMILFLAGVLLARRRHVRAVGAGLLLGASLTFVFWYLLAPGVAPAF